MIFNYFRNPQVKFPQRHWGSDFYLLQGHPDINLLQIPWHQTSPGAQKSYKMLRNKTACELTCPSLASKVYSTDVIISPDNRYVIACVYIVEWAPRWSGRRRLWAGEKPLSKSNNCLPVYGARFSRPRAWSECVSLLILLLGNKKKIVAILIQISGGHLAN